MLKYKTDYQAKLEKEEPTRGVGVGVGCVCVGDRGWDACPLGFPLLPQDGPCGDTDSRVKVTGLNG